MKKFAALLTAVFVLASPVWAQSGPRVPSEFAPRATDAPAGERVEALELRLAQLEQLLEAQRTLNNRNRLAEAQSLKQRLWKRGCYRRREISPRLLLPRQMPPPARRPAQRLSGFSLINWLRCCGFCRRKQTA